MDFENYGRIAESLPDRCIDLAMVDGRAWAAAIYAIKPKNKQGGFLLLDNSEREQYREAMTHLVAKGWVVQHFPALPLLKKTTAGAHPCLKKQVTIKAVIETEKQNETHHRGK
jgi:hypothetical protein